MGRGFYILTLDQDQQLLLKEVTDFIIEFEEKDYEDWVKREGPAAAHVYGKAKQLAYAMRDAEVIWISQTNNEK